MYLEYVMPLLFAFILVGLDNIQEHLENPFDQIGVDDVAINAEKFVHSLEH
jgi:predicted membrane chloride channel (bestrophin family)